MGLRPTHGDESPWGWSSADPGFGSAVCPPRAADRKRGPRYPLDNEFRGSDGKPNKTGMSMKRKDMPICDRPIKVWGDSEGLCLANFRGRFLLPS